MTMSINSSCLQLIYNCFTVAIVTIVFIAVTEYTASCNFYSCLNSMYSWYDIYSWYIICSCWRT